MSARKTPLCSPCGFEAVVGAHHTSILGFALIGRCDVVGRMKIDRFDARTLIMAAIVEPAVAHARGTTTQMLLTPMSDAETERVTTLLHILVRWCTSRSDAMAKDNPQFVRMPEIAMGPLVGRASRFVWARLLSLAPVMSQ